MLKFRFIIFYSFIFCFLTNKGQIKLSNYEIYWAIIHPFDAVKIKRHLNDAKEVYESVKISHVLDTFESGGKLDAFRHCYTMAFLSRYVHINKLRALGLAHENGNKADFYKKKLEFGERSDSLSCEMDLRNNELGFSIGQNYKKATTYELKQQVIEQIKAGQAWYLKRNQNNEYVTCNNNPILFNEYKNKWFIPKCLIKSNE